MIEIRPVPAEQVRALRQQVLRPHQSVEDLVYPGDDAPGSFHLAAYAAEHLVSTISLSLEEREPERANSGSFRLRGMATAVDYRGVGIGADLLAEALGRCSAAGGERVWCNARLRAVPFYERHDFHRIGPEFDLPGIGPHIVMERSL